MASGVLSNDERLRASRDAFRHALAADRRRMVWVFIVTGVLVVLMFAGMFVSEAYSDRTGIPAGSTTRLIPLYFMAPIPVISLIGGIGWTERRSHAKCQECRHALFSNHDPYIAMATGRCPHCAADLFELDASDNGQQTADSEARARDRAQRRAEGKAMLLGSLRGVWPWAAGGGGLLVVGIVMIPSVKAALAPYLGEVWLPFVDIALVAPGIIVGGWSIAAWERSLTRPPRECPHCDEALGSWADRTGNCSACGLPAVDEPFPGMQSQSHTGSSASRWTIAEFRTDAKQRSSRQWIGCFVGVGFALAWIVPFFLVRFWLWPSSEMRGVDILGFTGLALQALGPVWWDRRLARNLRCPDCERELLHYYRLTISTQHCYHCGSHALEAPILASE